MKKPISVTFVGFVCLLIFFLFSGLECNDDEPNDPTDSHCLYFRNYKVSWRPTPIDNLDRPLTPKDYFVQTTEDEDGEKAIFSYRMYESEYKVCIKEATVADFYLTVKTEFFDQFRFEAGINHNGEDHEVQWTTSQSGELTYAHAGITINGDPIGNSTDLRLAIAFKVPIHTDLETTYAFVNNVVTEITIDWAYTEW